MNIAPVTSQLQSEGVAYAPQIASAAAANGLDPNLLAAVAAQETGGPGSNAGRNVVGDGGHGHGVFQIDDRWHDFANTAAAMDPAKNASYAAGMISGLINKYGGNVKAALSAYNAGSPSATGTKTTWADGQTLGYADSVMRHYQGLTGQVPGVASSSPSGSLTEEAVAESASTSSLVNALASLMQQSATPPSIPTAPSQNSWQQTEGLDATGHSKNRSDNFDSADDSDA